MHLQNFDVNLHNFDVKSSNYRQTAFLTSNREYLTSNRQFLMLNRRGEFLQSLHMVKYFKKQNFLHFSELKSSIFYVEP